MNELTGDWRVEWTKLATAALTELGYTVCIDPAQGIHRERQQHMSAAARAIARRGGRSWQVEQYQGILERNAIRDDLREQGLDIVVGAGETVQGVLDHARSAVRRAAVRPVTAT